jgi:hypothetical protein
MKISRLMAAAAALSLGLAAGAPADAANYGPNPGRPAAMKYLTCILSPTLGPSWPSATQMAYIKNTSGLTIKKYSRIYINELFRNGKVLTRSFIITHDLVPGAFYSFDASKEAYACRGQVNLTAKLKQPPR